MKEQDQLGLEEIKNNLPDAGRLLIVLSEVEKVGEPDVDIKRLQIISFLLDKKEIFPFLGAFRFDPYPYSEELSSVLGDLVVVGYLIRDKENRVRLSDMGKDWVKRQEIDPELLTEISEELSELASMSDDRLFGHAFAVAVQSLKGTIKWSPKSR